MRITVGTTVGSLGSNSYAPFRPARLTSEPRDRQHGIDLRPPAEIIEEFIQTLVLLVERQQAAGPKVLRL